MTYYNNVQKAMKYLTQLANKAVNEEKELDAELVYYNVLDQFPVSRKIVYDRLTYLVETVDGLRVAKLPHKPVEVKL
jgi:hypothetical protein